MHQDANESALNKHLAEQEKGEIALENFRLDIQDELELIDESVQTIRQKAKRYNSYDLDSEIDECLSDIIYPSETMKKVGQLRVIKEDLLKVLGRLI